MAVAGPIELRCPHRSCGWVYKAGLDDPSVVAAHLATHETTASSVDIVELQPIPGSRVRQFVAALLGDEGALDNLRALTLHPGAIEAEVYALDESGHRFDRGGGEIAVDTIHLRIDWES